jgi:hypothetical protein
VLLDPEHVKNMKVGHSILDDKNYEGVNNTVDSSKCT